LLADATLTGAAWCRALSDLVDAWLSDLLTGIAGRDAEHFALVAVGGYGRAELCPQSDIDLMLLHDKRSDVGEVANRIWYPIWDEGLHLGHSVCTVKEALELAEDDLDTATAILSARHIAGQPDLTAQLAERATQQWERRSKRWLTELSARVQVRHERATEVAFSLEPDLKEGRGGLRDVHALRWAEAAHRILIDHDAGALARAYDTLLDTRVELQRHSGKPSNVLVLEDQDPVAAALGLADADGLMAGIAEAARLIAWTSDDTWRRIASSVRGPLGRLARRTRALAPGVDLRDGEVHVEPGTAATEPLAPLRAAAAAAQEHTVIDRASLESLAAATVRLPEPWPDEARGYLVQLLLAGRPAVGVIEALDQRGIWGRLMPEWQTVRSRPQRNAYHRYTVDRHLLEATANAAKLASRVGRPDLLVVAALLHDLGKGVAGDHVETGTDIAAAVTTRLGFDADDRETIISLVQQHLLLADVATRRDLDDPTTIERVAAAVVTVERLHLLAALTEADSLATGTAAWGHWKALLVDRLVERTQNRLEGGDTAPDGLQFPTDEQLATLAAGGRRIDAADDVVTVMTDDRPGVFSRVAGVLALHGLEVLTAAAHSTDDGRALNRFRVVDPVRPEPPWPKIVADLHLALEGRLALDARLAERSRTYSPRRRSMPKPAGAKVTFDDDASSEATVIDVEGPDAIGVLYRITRALADLDLDIRSAKVQTLGSSVVDAFYVRDSEGKKITDAHIRREIELAILHSLSD
ncbi:MAG: [protein-PII] uridylyltransferase, partial [Actinomycetota bacterium]|nr:[protein-PII] uridylyltransferase [Actinomycetota bacterium]